MLHQSLVFFGTEFSTIVFNTFSVTLIKCKAAISKFSAPPSHLSQGDHEKYDIILNQSEHENFLNHLHNDTKPVLSWVSIHKICNPQQPIHFSCFLLHFTGPKFKLQFNECKKRKKNNDNHFFKLFSSFQYTITNGFYLFPH